MPTREKPTASKEASANPGFETKLWLSADSRNTVEPEHRGDRPANIPLRTGQTAHGNQSNNMDASGPSGARQPASGSPKGERGRAKQYRAANVFRVPADARWSQLQSRAKLPSIGKDVDDDMVPLSARPPPQWRAQ